MVGGYGLPLLTFLHVSLGSPLAGAGEVGLSFSLSVLWLFWWRGAEWLSCHSIIWSGWWGCYTGEFWSWSCSQGTAALAQRAHQGRVMSWAPPHIQPASQVVLVVKNQCRRHKGHRFNPWVRKIPGGGHGKTLQYSCLEIPMDREAWWATVYRVAKNWT